MTEGEYTRDDLKRMGARWCERIRGREKAEKDWIDAATKAERAYLAIEKDGDFPPHFNILHSNVETIVPAIFNSSPVPDIRPRHGRKEDPIAKHVADIFERGVAAQVDDNRLDEEIEANAQDAFMAGRGVVRVKFDADIDDFGAVSGETILYEVVAWNDYRQGPAKRWRDVPYVAYRHEVSEETRKELEDPEIMGQYTEQDFANEDLDSTIWEIWCKETRKVYFIAEDSETVLSIKDDPLGLKGFFPQGKPIQPITATKDLTPSCPYSVYKTLAEELERATKRINAIMKGLKVRGLFAGEAADVTRLAQADDNELVTAANLEQLTAMGGIDKAIAWWPVDKAIQVLKELHMEREQTKQAIYEITGISDIVRGASKSSETATAQQIKTEWGSLRIKKMQKLIERQARELFVITAEILGKHFSPQTLQQITGLPVGPEHMQLMQSPWVHYRIDVESDSTIRADLTKSRQEMSGFLEGTGAFFTAMQPVVSTAPQTAAPLIKLYGSFASNFNLGKTGEDALDQFIDMAEQAANQPPPPNPEMEKMKAEGEQKQKEFEARMTEKSADLQMQVARFMMDMKGKEMDLTIKGEEHNLKRDEMDMDREQAVIKAAVAEHGAMLKADTAEHGARIKAATAEHSLKMKKDQSNGDNHPG